MDDGGGRAGTRGKASHGTSRCSPAPSRARDARPRRTASLLAEPDHVATRELGREAAVSAVDDIRLWTRRGRVAVPEITDDPLGVAQSVRARHRALDLGLADAVNVALAAEYDTDVVLTLDRQDFRAVRPLGRHKAFRVLPEPDDLPL
ncbi:VapC toxin family PIN domain ribonuclease [Streptomyces sp. CB03234]|uniref:VapC toxin family PIN domain ribonuclease n=1 Tax=Streptomyces sp. (strain CB03234) TaxID=1703937 RepID=UPI000A5E151C|nr:VapC toxin family PIN domain ribonuclease [Streptomyces sp. CB03234]